MALELEVVDTRTKKSLVRRFDGKVVTVGRDAANDVRLESESVAGGHAKLRYFGEEWLVDSLSHMHTFVNRERVVPTVPRSVDVGDVVQIAGWEIRIREAAAPAAPPPPPAPRQVHAPKPPPPPVHRPPPPVAPPPPEKRTHVMPGDWLSDYTPMPGPSPAIARSSSPAASSPAEPIGNIVPEHEEPLYAVDPPPVEARPSPAHAPRAAEPAEPAIHYAQPAQPAMTEAQAQAQVQANAAQAAQMAQAQLLQQMQAQVQLQAQAQLQAQMQGHVPGFPMGVGQFPGNQIQGAMPAMQMQMRVDAAPRQDAGFRVASVRDSEQIGWLIAGAASLFVSFVVGIIIVVVAA